MRRDAASTSEHDALRIERDFYERLVRLATRRAIDPLLEDALALIVEVTGATQAYLELGAADDDADRWWLARGCSDEDIQQIRATTSRGIVAEALATGRTIRTASALADPRFRERDSVRQYGIQAVLCAPVGVSPPLGVVYLQGRIAPGPFTPQDQQWAELLAEQLAPLADRLVREHTRDRSEDATRAVRQRLRCEGVIGRSAALAAVLEQAALVAPIDIDVLLTGPSGTGKTALAQVIARNSQRAGAPFVELNCAALPDALLESELFGAVRGGHSTATRAMPGKIQAADGGTLLLDEIGELSANAQAKLLQLLQSRQYFPLGASRPVSADVRIISATNVSLRERVAEGRFREDLFYRLHVMPIHVPALADRPEDIDLLVAHFVRQVAERHDLLPRLATRAACVACREAAWPGNVRELANAVQAAVIRAHGDGSDEVDVRHLFPDRDRAGPPDRRTFRSATRDFQRDLLERALDERDWNIAEVARDLELTRSHVYNLIHAHRLSRRPR